MHDAIIVGGGPGGSAVAHGLATAGRDVVVLEEHESLGSPVHCTGVLAAGVVSSLGLPPGIELNPLSTVRFVAPAGSSFDYSTAATEAVVIDRQAFDLAMSARAASSGARIDRGRRVIDVEPGANRVRVTLADGAAIESRSVVLACGANYTFQRRLGMGMPSTFLQSAQMELPADRIGDVEVHFGSEIAPKGFAWAVPVQRASGLFVRVGVMAEANAREYFLRILGRVGDRLGVTAPGESAPRLKMLPLGSVRRTYANRVLAVGDAAGLVKPTTGGGIYYSVVSGELAAEVLHAQLATGDLSAGALRDYERKWRSRFQPEFKAQFALRFIAQRMRDADIDALFELARTDGILPLVRQKARFNQHRDFIMALLRHQPARRALFGWLAKSA